MHLCYSFNSSISYYLCMILKGSASWFILSISLQILMNVLKTLVPKSVSILQEASHAIVMARKVSSFPRIWGLVRWNIIIMIFYFSWCQETAKHLLPSISALHLIYWSIHNFLSPCIQSNLFLLLRFIFFFSFKISKQHPLIISPHQDNSSFVK